MCLVLILKKNLSLLSILLLSYFFTIFSFADTQNKCHRLTDISLEEIDASKAISACKSAIKTDPDNISNWFFLGRAYHKAKKYENALIWFHKAVDQGNAGAQNSLGFFYDEGLGVLQDKKEALKWYKLSADQGFALAQFNLGATYHFGNDLINIDFNEAFKWYTLAAKQGQQDAIYNLGYMYQYGEGVEINFKKAL